MNPSRVEFRPVDASRGVPVTAECLPARSPVRSDGGSPGGSASRAWLLFAVASLLVSGIFALLLVIARVPPLSNWIGDPDFFRRCLVLHVNLSLLVWFTAFLACLYTRLPGPRRPVPQRVGLTTAVAGTVAMALSAFAPGSAPILSNYIPFIQHPLFVAGLFSFLAGLALCVSGGPLLCNVLRGRGDREALSLPPDAGVGVRVAACLFLVALVTFLVSWAKTPASLPPEAYFELSVWGGGHVLQVVNVAAMVSVWLWLAGGLSGRDIVRPRTALLLFGLLALPHLVSPFLALGGTATPGYHAGFTRLMQFGLFPVVLIFIAICGWRLIRDLGWRIPRLEGTLDYRLIGLGLSVLMTLVGFVLGAMIRGSNTMIPAHYHASIGAVTVAFMAAAFLMAERPVVSPLAARFRRWRPAALCCFGGGQLLFALGFAVGGAHGLGRKQYGSEQVMYSAGEYVGVVMMGLGGLIAVAGGVAFLGIIGILLLGSRRRSRACGEEFLYSKYQ